MIGSDSRLTRSGRRRHARKRTERAHSISSRVSHASFNSRVIITYVDQQFSLLLKETSPKAYSRQNNSITPPIKCNCCCVFKSPQLRLVAEGFTVLGAIIYLVLEIKDVLITQGINAQLNTLVRLSNLFSNLPLILRQGCECDTRESRENQE